MLGYYNSGETCPDQSGPRSVITAGLVTGHWSVVTGSGQAGGADSPEDHQGAAPLMTDTTRQAHCWVSGQLLPPAVDAAVCRPGRLGRRF